jgi:hypothetical protein
MSESLDLLMSFVQQNNRVCIEFAYGTETILVQLITNEPHRRAGNGLRMRLFVPLEAPSDDHLRTANRLNQTEATGGADCMHCGAWCVDRGPSPGSQRSYLQYQLFVPNALHRLGLAQDVMFLASKRAHWTDWGIHGEKSKADARQIMMERMTNWLRRATTALKGRDRV